MRIAALMKPRASSSSTLRTRSGLAYRREIDGLRALAVLPVVFFHAGFVGFNGGFVGVDVFFVISGYLITAIIVGALEAGRFSAAHFYERRIRRIIPVFVILVTATSIAAVAFLPPHDLTSFGLSAAAAAAFASNFFFSANTGYFAGPKYMMPLLHTWSLGVEEQFYIVWPLILWACHRLGFRLGTKALVITLAAASLGYSAWSANAASSFYLPQSRAWELMIGAILAMKIVPRIESRWLRDGLGLLGVGLIIFAVTVFTAKTPFPGLWALVPCLGAALIIHSGQSGDTAVSNLLSLRPFVFIGLISYSLYLWHWPIFAFVQNFKGEKLNLEEGLILTAVSIALAIVSWRYVERPFRERVGVGALSPRACFVGGAAALALTASIGSAIFFDGGLPGRLAPEALRISLASEDLNPLQANCHVEGATIPPVSSCIIPASNADSSYDIIEWGDSFADALFPGIALFVQKYGLSVRQATHKGCAPLIGDQREHGCAEFNLAILHQLEQEPRPHRPRLAVLVGQWSGHPGEGVLQGLAAMIDALNAAGIRALVVGEPAAFRADPNRCFVRQTMYHRSNAEECFKLPRREAEQRLRESREILMQVLQDRAAAKYVDLDPILCDREYCWAKMGGQPLYRNNDHLSLSGARVVGAALSENPSLKPWLTRKGAGAVSVEDHRTGD